MAVRRRHPARRRSPERIYRLGDRAGHNARGASFHAAVGHTYGIYASRPEHRSASIDDYSSQFSTLSAGTRLNSATFAVTHTAPMARA